MSSPIEHLRNLVKIPSVNPMGRPDVPLAICFETKATDYLETVLKGLGCQYMRKPVMPGRDNLVATYDSGKPGPTILLESHVDTIPTDGMTIDPFRAEERDGRLYGRGACDVKGGLSSMLAAFSRVCTDKPTMTGRVILAMTVDEEHNFSGIHALAKSGIEADFAIVAEPTSLDIVTAHKGLTRWTIETTGQACHSSRPQDGDNAIYHMARIVYEVETFAEILADRPKHPHLGKPTLSLGRIDGGTSTNTVPDFCRIELDRRLLPGETASTAVAELTEFLQRDPNTADLPFRASAPLFVCPPLASNQPPLWLDRLGGAIERTTKKNHARIAVPFGTNASTLAEAGIPSVVFGPGSIAQAHTKDEWVELKQVEQASEILFKFICNI